MQITPSITIVPVLHGKLAFAQHVRSLCLARRYDCIAVDLPPQFADDLVAAVDNLPYVSAVMTSPASEPVYYIPTDPGDAMIEGIRQARQNRVPVAFIGSPALSRPRPLTPLPDEHAMTTIGFDAFASLCLLAVGRPEDGSEDDLAGRHCARMLRDREAAGGSVLALVHFRHFAATIRHLASEQSYNAAGLAEPLAAHRETTSAFINPDHLYFALGELPFVAGRFEQSRYDPLSLSVDPLEAVKDLFRETRDDYFESRDQIQDLSPARIQVALTFLRNLTVMSGMLLPDLFDIVASAKGVGGNGYAVRILKSARYYPYLPLEGELVSVGIDRIALPGRSGALEAVNLFRDIAMQWRKLSIKPDPSLEKKRLYRYRWNPNGMCSHIPEDRRIESFNAHVRRKALRVLTEDFVRSEKFLTSVKDGIDVRETLRNWFTGDIYVKEAPPSRGNVDTVVIIFDQDHDERYPHRATWYAEHKEESTLAFYATDPFENPIGPGIARSQYGGLALLFPPRPIPNLFEVTGGMKFRNLAQQLACGAAMFSRERNVAYVAPRKPDVATVSLVNRLKRHLVWIPLSAFSTETLRRLQRFHVLNGKVVRSWASRFVDD